MGEDVKDKTEGTEVSSEKPSEGEVCAFDKPRQKRKIFTLGNLVKGAVTVAVPPVGLALFGKSAGARVIEGFIGMMVSTALCTSIAFFKYTDTVIDNAPKIVSSYDKLNSSFALFLELSASPLAFYFDDSSDVRGTIIDAQDGKDTLLAHNRIEFPAPISFNSQTGKYVLTFDESTALGSADFDTESVGGMKQRVAEQAEVLRGYVSKGDVINGRTARAELTKLEEELAGVEKKYGEMREVYDSHVTRLNAELSGLAGEKLKDGYAEFDGLWEKPKEN